MFDKLLTDLKTQFTKLVTDEVGHLIDQRFALFRTELEQTVSHGDLAEEIDLSKLAKFLDTDDLVSQVLTGVDLTDHICYDSLAGDLDYADLAGHIDYDELQPDVSEVAAEIDLSELAEYLTEGGALDGIGNIDLDELATKVAEKLWITAE